MFRFHVVGEKEGEKDLWYKLEGWGDERERALLGMATLSPKVSVHYSKLPKREKLRLGKQVLRKAVVKISNYNNGMNEMDIKKKLLAIAQMFLKSMRFDSTREALSKIYDGQEAVLDEKNLYLQNR